MKRLMKLCMFAILKNKILLCKYTTVQLLTLSIMFTKDQIGMWLARQSTKFDIYTAILYSILVYLNDKKNNQQTCSTFELKTKLC